MLKHFVFSCMFVFVFLFSSVVFASENNPNSTPKESQSIFYISETAMVSGKEYINVVTSGDVIYVSPNTSIYGEINVSNVKIEKLPEASMEKKNGNATQNVLGLSKEFVPNEKVVDKSLQQLQDRLKEQVRNTLFTSSKNARNFLWSKNKSENGIINPTSSISCYGNLINVSYYDYNTFTLQPERLVFYTCLHYLEFPKLRNSLLRGPPFV